MAVTGTTSTNLVPYHGIKNHRNPWWRHQMETFSALLVLCTRNSQVTGEFPHKVWRGTLMFSLICAWINGWVNTREAGDLRRHRIHYAVVGVEIIWSSAAIGINANGARSSMTQIVWQVALIVVPTRTAGVTCLIFRVCCGRTRCNQCRDDVVRGPCGRRNE